MALADVPSGAGAPALVSDVSILKPEDHHAGNRSRMPARMTMS